MSGVKFVIPDNPTVKLEGNYSFKALKDLEDSWRMWCYRKYEDEKQEVGEVEFDDDFPMTKKEWRRAKRLYMDEDEARKMMPRSFDWNNVERIKTIADCAQMEHVKRKKEEAAERQKWEKWMEEKVEKEKLKKKTYAEAVKGRSDLQPVKMIYCPQLGGTLVLLATFVSLMSPGNCAPVADWTKVGDSMMKQCNGIMMNRAVDDTTYGYTNRMWDRCCRESEKTVNPPAVGICEIRNSKNPDNINKKLFDLYYNDLLKVEGRHCIEMVRLCRDFEERGIWGLHSPRKDDEDSADLKSEDERDEGENNTEANGNSEGNESVTTQQSTSPIERPKPSPWHPVQPSWYFDLCERTPLQSVDLRTVLNMEFCLGYCEIEGRPVVTVDQKWFDGFKRQECWEETKEEWQLEDEQVVWKSLAKNKGFNGGRAMKKCHFRDCEKNEKPLSRFEVWIDDGKRLNMSICETCESRNFPKECLVTVRGSNTDVVIDMIADLGDFYIRVGDDHREGRFPLQKSLTMEINGPGSKTITGYCNDRVIERKFVVTTNEYCNEKYKGMFEKIELIYCKQHKLVRTLVLILIILVILYYGSEVIGAFLGALVSLIFLLVTVFLVKKIMCSICSKITLFGVGHRCSPKKCIYCGCEILTEQGISEMSKDEIKEFIYDHQHRRCKKFVSSNLFVISLMNYFRVFYGLFTYLFKKAPSIMICIVLIWIASVIFSEADAYKLSDFVKTNKSLVLSKRPRNRMEKSISDSYLLKGVKFDSCAMQFLLYNIVMPVIAIILLILRKPIARVYVKSMKLFGYVPCNFCYRLMHKNNLEMAHDCKKIFCQTCKSLWGTSGYFDKDENIRSIISEHDCFTGSRDMKAIRCKSDFIKKMTVKLVQIPAQLVFMLTILLTVKCVLSDHYSEMKKMENDLGDMIQELKREGFHPYSARFSGGLRENIAAVRENKECKSGTCRVQMEIETTLKVKEGREYGFIVKNKHKYNNLKDLGEAHLNVKLSNLKSVCDYKVLYKTGPAKHRQYSGDTCTEGCAKCQEYLKDWSKEKEDKSGGVYEVNHENTASWGCDGPGCMAINQGCTCGRCYCVLEDDDTEVLELVKEKQTFDLCIQLGGAGYCKNMEKETKEKKIFVINFEESMEKCPKIIAREKNGKVLEGDMNKAGEFDNKFGSVQKIGETTMTKREERYQEHCLFAKHRYMTFDQCCKDTYHMKNYLKKSELKPSSTLRFEKPEREIGTWKINLLVPPLSYTEKEDVLKLEQLKIEDCLGCHNCEEGGSCLLQYKSSHEATVNFECTPCSIDSVTIHLMKGIKSTPFNIFCKGEEVNLSCKVSGKEVKAKFRLLKQPNKPHGDGYINMDREKFIHEDCEGLFCGLKLPSLNLFGWVKWVIIVIIIIVSAIALFWTVKVLYLFFSKVKNY